MSDTNKEYSSDVLISADWVEDRLGEFQSDDPMYRIIEVSTETKTSGMIKMLVERGGDD